MCPIVSTNLHSQSWYTLTNTTFISLGIVYTDKEVEKDADATLTCTVSGLSVAATIEWRSVSGGSALISDNTNYDIGGAGFSDSTNEQESILTVKAAANTADSILYCTVTSAEWAKTNVETPVVLDVFGTFTISVIMW